MSHERESDRGSETAGRAFSTVIGMVIGGAVGAAAALLFAPKRGEETRADVVQWTRDTERKAADMVRGAGSSVASTLRQVPQTVQRKAPEMVSKAVGAFRRGGEQVAEKVEAGSEKAAQGMERRAEETPAA